MSKFTVEAKGINVSFDKGQVQIVKNTSFAIEGKNLVSICGPNGAGKTTLLRALAGLIPAEGEIKILGKNIKEYRRRELAASLAYMHQDTVLSFSFPVRDVVAMGRYPHLSRMSDLSKRDKEIIEESMDLAGCYEYSDKYITQLSAGERQRVMLARALAQETPIIFLDEPTSAQDIKNSEESLYLLAELAEKKGKTLVTVLHDLRLAAKYSTQTALMYEGQMVAFGDPEEVFHEGHLEYVFHIRTKVFKNPAGQWDFYNIL